MKLIITGATGFIGKRLVGELLSKGHRVVALTRDPKKAGEMFKGKVETCPWDGRSGESWSELITSDSGIINLAGEEIGHGDWTKEKKESILKSRVLAGLSVVDAIKRSLDRPRFIIQASAVGFYGNRGDEVLTERSGAGSEFLSQVVQKWEASSAEAEKMGIRRVIVRSAMVLGGGGGVLKEMSRPVGLFFSVCPGSGRQWYSWIHMDDEVAAILFLMDRADLSGVFNLSSPRPVTAKEFCKAMSGALYRPLLSVPEFIVRSKFGEKGDELMLSSKKVVPKRLIEAGFSFKYPSVDAAVREALK